MQDSEIREKQRSILRAIADYSEQNDLPMPRSLFMNRDATGVSVHLQRNDQTGVRRWGAMLNLAVFTGVGDITAVGPWRGATVEISAQLSTRKTGEQA